MEFCRKSKRAASAIAGFLIVISVSGRGLRGPAHKAPAPNVTAVIDLGFTSYDPINVTSAHTMRIREWWARWLLSLLRKLT